MFQGDDGNDTIYGANYGDYAAGGENGTDALYGGDDRLDKMDFDENPSTPDTVNCGAGRGGLTFHNPEDTLMRCENHRTERFIIQDTP